MNHGTPKFKVTTNKTFKLTQVVNTEVISSQHCIRIDDDEVELIYYFKDFSLQVYCNAELIYNNKFQPGHVALNYLNVVEVTTKVYSDYQKRRKMTEKHQECTKE